MDLEEIEVGLVEVLIQKNNRGKGRGFRGSRGYRGYRGSRGSNSLGYDDM